MHALALRKEAADNPYMCVLSCNYCVLLLLNANPHQASIKQDPEVVYSTLHTVVLRGC